MTFEILRPESPRLIRRLAVVMDFRDWKATAHRVYSMLDANLLVFDCENNSDDL